LLGDGPPSVAQSGRYSVGLYIVSADVRYSITAAATPFIELKDSTICSDVRFVEDD